MIVKLLTEHYLDSKLKRRLQRLIESTLIKMSNCWKSHAAAHLISVAYVHFSSYLISQAHYHFSISLMSFTHEHF